MPSVAVAGRADLTDAQWARLEPLPPRPKKAGRSSKWTKRQLIDGIRWRTRAGAPWRDVPAEYGSRQAIYSLFRMTRSNMCRVVDYMRAAAKRHLDERAAANPDAERPAQRSNAAGLSARSAARMRRRASEISRDR